LIFSPHGLLMYIPHPTLRRVSKVRLTMASPALATLVLLGFPDHAPATTYSFTAIDAPGALSTYPSGINDSGQIVGQATGFGAFLDTAGSFTIVNVPGATNTSASGINNSGQIVGWYGVTSGTYGFLDTGGNFTTISIPPGTSPCCPVAPGTFPRGINDSGHVVGQYNSTAGARSFLDTGGSISTINVPGASFTAAYGINSSGQIVGSYSSSASHGFLDTAGSLATIDVPGALNTYAIGINRSGQIVGYYVDTSGTHGFLDIAGRFSTIDVPGATGQTIASGINNSGQIVGYYSGASGYHGFVATPVPGVVPAISLLTTIAINGTAASPNTPMFSFDISFVDPANGLFYLADRSNRAIDIIDTTGTNTGICGPTDTGPDTLCGQVGGASIGFAGYTGSNATSGPDGVLAIFPCVFAGDGNSRVVAFNWNKGVTNVAGTLNTGGTTRVDEMAYDPNDNILIVVNNAETPPFATLIKISPSTCAMSNPIKVSFGTLPTATHVSPAVSNPTATNGAEQPVWDPVTQRFYEPIPEVNGPGDDTGPNGGLAQINPLTGKIENFFQVNFCQPSGSAAGPNGDLLLQCSVVFDLTGKACVAAAPSPAGQPSTIQLAECTGTSGAQVVICNPSRGCTPSNGSIVSVPGPGGGDEVWFNSGDNNYYIAQQNNPVGASLAVVASGATSTPNTLLQFVPTLPPQGAIVPTAASGALKPVAPSAHSVAASEQPCLRAVAGEQRILQLMAELPPAPLMPANRQQVR
jgi:uncharacterized membrane protein